MDFQFLTAHLCYSRLWIMLFLFTNVYVISSKGENI